MALRVAVLKIDRGPWVRYRIKFALTACFAAAVIVVWLVATAGAQDPQGGYTVDPIDPTYDTRVPENDGSLSRDEEQALRRQARDNRQNLSRDRQVVLDLLAGQGDLNQNRPVFDRYFKGYVFAHMTQLDIDSLSSLGKQREDFFKNFARRSTSVTAMDYLVRDLTFVEMSRIAEGDYHPAVRVNALRMIGRLNLREGDHNNAIPAPFVDGLTYLLAKLNDAATADLYKAACMFGVVRHAELDGQLADGQRLPAATRNQMITTMLAQLGAPPADRDPDLHYWLQRQSIRALGHLRMTGTANAVPQALYVTLDDANASTMMRCDAAVAYGMMPFATANDAKAADVSLTLAEIALQAAQDELEYLASSQEELDELARWRAQGSVRAGSRGGGYPGAGPGSGGPGSGGPGSGGPGSGGPGSGGPGAGGPGGAPGGAPGGGAPGGAPGGGAPGSGRGGRGGGQPPGSGPGQGLQFSGAETAGLPAYRLTLSRRRLKTVVFAMQTALGTSGQPASGVGQFGNDAATNQLITDLRAALGQLMTASDAGLNVEDANEPALQQFKQAVTRAANRIEAIIEASGPQVEDSLDPSSGNAADGDILDGN